jgi:hypothetical protein
LKDPVSDLGAQTTSASAQGSPNLWKRALQATEHFSSSTASMSAHCWLLTLWLVLARGFMNGFGRPRVPSNRLVIASDSFGQSFIGQDVCGSKYNDDPFVAAEGKGDAWKEFQRRMLDKEAEQLSAAKNLTKAEALKELEGHKSSPGKWP